MKQKHLLLVTVLLIFAFSIGVSASDTIQAVLSDYKLFIDNYDSGVKIVKINNEYYIPLSNISKQLSIRTEIDISKKQINVYSTTYLQEYIKNKNTDTSIYLYIVADDDKATYLGKLTTDKFDTDSIYNEYGDYGSKYSNKSIWNQYGNYGGEYSRYSPFNQYTSNPPKVYDSTGKYYGRLTVNTTTQGYLDPNALYKILVDLGL